MIVFTCKVCQTLLSAEESQAGQYVRCPSCQTTLTVPAQPGARQPATVGAPGSDPAPSPPPRPPLRNLAGMAGTGRRFGFNCSYCSSRLEATEAMSAQEGQCPTCGSTIVIPILDRYGRLIDPRTQQIIKQDPHPVHAYAAAGDRAPQVVRDKDGAQSIRCPRCRAMSSVTSNNCKACGMPFTMEGTTAEGASVSNGFCVASLVLGIVGLPAACTVITPLLAVIFGIIGYHQAAKADGSAGRGMAIAGIICGVIGCLLAVWIIIIG
jgi:DNA-directed RNA polymerase subunit RPC12/RpoP